MQCVILAAGRGTRMLPLTESFPKPLLLYKNKPILEWNLDNLPQEIDEIIFVTGYLGDKIQAFVSQKNIGRRCIFVKQAMLNGTGGALTACKDILKNKFLVLNGDDVYSQNDLSRLIAHKRALLGFWSKEWGGTSMLVDASGNLQGIEVNPPKEEEKIANTGAYVLDEIFFHYPLAAIKHGKEFSIPHTLVTISKDHPIFVERATFWKQFNTPEDLEQ